MLSRRACRPSIPSCAYGPPEYAARAESSKERSGPHSTDKDGPGPCRHFLRFSPRTACLNPRLSPKGKESCWNEGVWTPSITNCRPLLACGQMNQVLKPWKKKEMEPKS